MTKDNIAKPALLSADPASGSSLFLMCGNHLWITFGQEAFHMQRTENDHQSCVHMQQGAVLVKSMSKHNVKMLNLKSHLLIMKEKSNKY